MAKAGVEL